MNHNRSRRRRITIAVVESCGIVLAVSKTVRFEVSKSIVSFFPENKGNVQTMAKASSLAENLAKQLECAVCLEQYKEPKVLPCLHSFCKRCLEGLLTKHGLAWKINCPSCRTSVEVCLYKFHASNRLSVFGETKRN